MPNFMLKNPNSDAPIEQTADSKENNQCCNDERPDVGDSRGNRHIVGVGDESFAREPIANYVAFHYTIACINHLARHHVVQHGFHRDKIFIILVLYFKQAFPSGAVAKQRGIGVRLIEVLEDVADLADVAEQIEVAHGGRHDDGIL